MKKFYFLYIACTINVTLFAQTTFEKTFFNEGIISSGIALSGMTQSNDNSYVIATRTYTNSIPIVFKTNNFGNIMAKRNTQYSLPG